MSFWITLDMCVCPRVPDKASLLSRPSTTIHRIDIGSAQRYPQPRRSSRASCGVGDATDHGEPQASVRATGIVVNGSRTQNRGVAIHHRYKRVTALRMRAWRWHGGPSYAHTTYESTGSQSAKRTATSTTTGRYGHGRASLSLERHPGESERNERNCGTTVPNHAAQRDTLRAEFGRPNSVCLTRCRRSGSS